GRLLHHSEVTSAVPALGRSTDPPGSSEETPRRPPTVYSVQGDGYCAPTVLPQLQNLWRAHFVAALSCSGLRELATTAEGRKPVSAGRLIETLIKSPLGSMPVLEPCLRCGVLPKKARVAHVATDHLHRLVAGVLHYRPLVGSPTCGRRDESRPERVAGVVLRTFSDEMESLLHHQCH